MHAFLKAYRVNVELFQADGVLFIDGGFNQSIKLQKRGDHYLFKSRNKEDIHTDTHEIQR